MHLVGFKKSHKSKMKQMMESKEPIHIDDCQIKSAKWGNGLEILLKGLTQIKKSPKKIDTTNMQLETDEILLIQLDAKVLDIYKLLPFLQEKECRKF